MNKDKRRWKKVEVEVMISTIDSPELIYRLPSRFLDKKIEVYEDPFNLAIKYVCKEIK